MNRARTIVQGHCFVVRMLRGVSLGCILIGIQACGTRRQIVQKEKISTEYDVRIRADTLLERDTVHIYTRGDTVYRDRITHRYRYTKWRDSIIKSDSIPYAVEVIREVNKLRPMQRWAIAGCYILLTLLVLWLSSRLRMWMLTSLGRR